LWSVEWRRPRNMRRQSMAELREKLLSIHHELNMNPKSDTAFDEFMRQWRSKVLLHYYSYLRFRTVVIDISRYISPKDHIYIDKLYIKL
jgi:hypothetical protein